MNFKEQNKTRPRPWIKYYSSPSAADLEYPDGTMYDVFRDAALRNPDAPAIDYMTSRMTFQTLHREVLRCAAALKERGASVTLREGFGLTECVTASALTPASEYRRGSVGIPYSDTFYMIAEPGKTTELAPGTDGEICISGPTVMNGYLDNPEETARALRIHEDGRLWLHTGDLGSMDEDGFIYFKSRIKRMVKCSGYSVYPSQVEEIINSHEAVAISCVIGVPDDYKMNRLKAFIVLKDGIAETQAVKDSIRRHCMERIARYAVPKDFVFRKSLPLTKVGKVAYTVLEQEEMTAHV